MNRVIIGIGSNINPVANIDKVRQIFKKKFTTITESQLVETEPIGFFDQPNFINGAILVETAMTREALAAWLKQVESDLGRVRTSNKNGPRTIDLDIVVWNGTIIDDQFYQRDFLKKAVLELWPGIRY